MLGQFGNIAIAVNDIEAAIERYEQAFGWKLEGEVMTQTALGIQAAILNAPGLSIELITPLPGEQVLRRFLDTRGEGFYRLAFRTDNCDEAIAHFDANDVRHVELSADSGQRIVFIHPKSAHGLMVELVEGLEDEG